MRVVSLLRPRKPMQICGVVPDGVVAFFPSYSYMETAVAAWHGMGILRQVRRYWGAISFKGTLHSRPVSRNSLRRTSCSLWRRKTSLRRLSRSQTSSAPVTPAAAPCFCLLPAERLQRGSTLTVRLGIGGAVRECGVFMTTLLLCRPLRACCAPVWNPLPIHTFSRASRCVGWPNPLCAALAGRQKPFFTFVRAARLAYLRDTFGIREQV